VLKFGLDVNKGRISDGYSRLWREQLLTSLAWSINTHGQRNNNHPKCKTIWAT